MRVDNLEEELTDLRESQRQLDGQHASLLEQYVLESDRLCSELSRLSREKEIIHDQLRTTEQKYATEKQKGNEIRRASDDNQKQFKARICTLESEIKELEHQYLSLRSELKVAEEGVHKRKGECDLLLESLHREEGRRFEELGQTYRSKLEEMKNKARRAIEKERKRGDAYKELALVAQRKGKSLTGAALALAASGEGHSD